MGRLLLKLYSFIFKDCMHCKYYDIMPHLVMGYDTGYCTYHEHNVKNTYCCDCWILRKK